VTQNSNELPESQPLPPTARLLWLVVILSTLYLCYFHNLGAIGLVGPDEPRYAWIARDMQDTGDYITPRLYGKPWFEKPPLYYWGAALSFKFLGVSEASARLPSAVCALLATLALAWLALRLYGAETARWLLLLLPTTVGMIGFSHAAATDMPFAAMLTIAMVFAAQLVNLTPSPGLIPSPTQQSESAPIEEGALRSSTSFTSPPSFTSILFGFFLGLATLAKGPAALILAGGTVLLWALFTKRWRGAFRCLNPAAIAAFCLTALPWYILCAYRNHDFFRVFIIEHNFNRFLTPEFQHIQPFWYYVPIFILGIFPWIFLHALAKLQFLANWMDKLPETASQGFFLAWAGFTFLFFTLSQSKLPGYIMPAIPPMALLMANAAASIAKDPHRFPRWPVLGTGLTLLVFGIALQRQAHRIPAEPCAGLACGVTPIWVSAILGGIVVGVLAARRRVRTSLFAALLTTLLLVAEVDRFLPAIDAGISGRSAARTVKFAWPELSLDNAAIWQINRSFAYQLDFYAHKEIPEWKPGDPRPALLFVARGKQQEAANYGFRCVDFVVLPAVIPCRDAGSLGGLNGGSAGGSLSNGQPR
jgi:4-amino-4-deoxy-L-arabinose transferase-like glycosyltransferase